MVVDWLNSRYCTCSQLSRTHCATLSASLCLSQSAQMSQSQLIYQNLGIDYEDLMDFSRINHSQKWFSTLRSIMLVLILTCEKVFDSEFGRRTRSCSPVLIDTRGRPQ